MGYTAAFTMSPVKPRVGRRPDTYFAWLEVFMEAAK
jgi:hypothetical protein